MNSYKTIISFVSLCILALLLTSCTKESTEEPCGNATYRLRFIATRTGFDAATRAAETEEWNDGDRVFLQFKIGSQYVPTWADYNATEQLWEIDQNIVTSLGGIPEGECEAYYFDAPSSLTGQRVTMNTQTIILSDAHATFFVDEISNIVTVKGELTPLTARLRMKGKPGSSFSIIGLARLTAYQATTNSFTKETSAYNGTIEENGLSQPLYVTFADNNSRHLEIRGEGAANFVRDFDESVLRPATSGRITLPTTEQMGKWTLVNRDNGLVITLPSVSTGSTEVSSFSAELTVAVSDTGNGTVLEAGFLVADNESMTNAREVLCTPSSLTCELSGLEPTTTYFICPFVRNERGTEYGSVSVIITPEKNPVSLEDYNNDELWDTTDEGTVPHQSSITQDEYEEDESWDRTDETTPTSHSTVSQEEYATDEGWDESDGNTNNNQNNFTNDDYPEDENWD